MPALVHLSFFGPSEICATLSSLFGIVFKLGHWPVAGRFVRTVTR